jgi:DNA-binding MarR family transcriptional regulator
MYKPRFNRDCSRVSEPIRAAAGGGLAMSTGRQRDRDTRAVLDAVRRVVRFLRQNAAAAGPRGLTAAQRFVLQTLAGERSLSVNELAERTYTDQSTVSVVAKRLVQRGLVSRERSPDDRRRVDLTLTRRGRELIERDAPDAPSALLVSAIAALDPATRRELAASLSALVRRMGLDRAPAPMLFEDEIGGARPQRGR